MFVGDLTTEQGKQDYDNYIMNNVRNEINSYTKQTQNNSGSVPVADATSSGIISAFGGVNLPVGYLWCDGTQQLIASYPKLWAALGVNRYGVDTATQFFLPNLTSHLPRGAATTGGAVTTNNNNTHGHGNNATNASFTGTTNNTGGRSADHTHGVNAGGTNGDGAGNTGVNNANTTRATGNLAVAASGHIHGTPGHNHALNGANTGGASADHSHGFTPAGNVAVTTGTVVDNTTYVPAFVEVNYIIKT